MVGSEFASTLLHLCCAGQVGLDERRLALKKKKTGRLDEGSRFEDSYIYHRSNLQKKPQSKADPFGRVVCTFKITAYSSCLRAQSNKKM